MSIIDRLENVLRIPENHLTHTPPPPNSLKIELTSRCNFRCVYCPYTSNKHIQKDMDWNLFKKIVEDASKNNIKEIGLFLIGEPFMNFNLLIRAIKFCKEEMKIPFLFLTSNASLADSDKVKKCMAAGLDSLKWSCNVADEKQFRDVVGVQSDLFFKAIQNIKHAWEIRKKYDFKTEISASSILYDNDQKNKMVNFLNKNVFPFVDKHYWLPLYNMGGVVFENEIKNGLNPISGNSGNLEILVPKIPCWSLFTAAHILVDGTMTACCSDGTGDWAVGNLKEQSFIDAWNSIDFQNLRKAHLKNDISGTKCKNCIKEA